MSNPVSKLFMAAIFIYMLTVSAVWADRILIDDPQQTVTVADNFSCYRPVDITVDAVTPDLYETNQAQLQKLGDSVRAMLSYECPDLSSIMLTGLIRGLDEIVYQGELTKTNNWLIQSFALNETVSGLENTLPDFTASKKVTKRYQDELKQGQLDVTGLHLGMSIDDVTDSVIQTFGIKPHYDAAKGLMTMQNGQCPADLNTATSIENPDADLKCLKAWFSDNRVERLQRLNLYQLVKADISQVNDLLLGKYGNPTQTQTADDTTQTQMVWRAINLDSGESVIQEVDAVISKVDHAHVATSVSLYNTQAIEPDNEQLADIDLKL